MGKKREKTVDERQRNSALKKKDAKTRKEEKDKKKCSI